MWTLDTLARRNDKPGVMLVAETRSIFIKVIGRPWNVLTNGFKSPLFSININSSSNKEKGSCVFVILV